MQRRGYLTAVGASLLAGCLGSPTSNGNGPDDDRTNQSGDDVSQDDRTVLGQPLEAVTRADEHDPAPAGDGFPSLSIADDPGPDGPGRGMTVAVGIVDQYTAEQPARLQVDLINASSDDRPVNFGASMPVDSFQSQATDRGARAFLAPEDEVHVSAVPAGEDEVAEHPSSPVDGCWTIGAVAHADLTQGGTIPPNYVLSNQYDIYAAAENDGCLPPGAYRFEQSSPRLAFTLAVE